MEVKLGDVVRMRCGGPEMVVDDIATDRKGVVTAHTVWHEKGALHYSRLPVEAFEIVKAAPSKRTHSPNDLSNFAGMRMPESWRVKVGYYSKVAQFRQRLVQNMPWA